MSSKVINLCNNYIVCGNKQIIINTMREQPVIREYIEALGIEYMLSKENRLQMTKNVKAKSSAILYRAVCKDKPILLRFLLQHGYDLNAPISGSGFTALHFAAKENQISCMKIILKDKAWIDLEAKDKRGNTPLYYAVKNAHVEAVKKLLKAGASPASSINRGWESILVYSASLIASEPYDERLEISVLLKEKHKELQLASHKCSTS